MRIFSLFVVILLMASCDSAGPGFRGVDKVERSFEGSRFTMRFRGDLVEAIRTSPEMLPTFPPVARKAGILAQMETGCRAAWVEGDPAMMLIGLSCDGRKAPSKPKRRKMMYCDLTGLTGRNGTYEGQLDCGKY